MDDLTVVLLGAAALGAGVLLASKSGRQSPALVPTTMAPITQVPGGGHECHANLGTFPVGQVPSSEELARRLIAQTPFTPSDIPAATRAIEQRMRATPQTPGPHKLFPYYDPSTNRMIDVGYRYYGGVRGPLSYVSYPVGGTPAQGTWRPI